MSRRRTTAEILTSLIFDLLILGMFCWAFWAEDAYRMAFWGVFMITSAISNAADRINR